jgi:hypothetical protein
MQHNSSHTRQSLRTTASELSEMGFCERKIVLKHRLGSRVAPSRRVAQIVGTKEHDHFLHSELNDQPNVDTSVRPGRPPDIPYAPSLLRLLLGLVRQFRQTVSMSRLFGRARHDQ